MLAKCYILISCIILIILVILSRFIESTGLAIMASVLLGISLAILSIMNLIDNFYILKECLFEQK